MNRTLLAKLARLEVQHAARTGADQSQARAKVEAAREQVARILEAFPVPEMPKASVAMRLARAVAEYAELRQSFERMARKGDGFAAAILCQAARWIADAKHYVDT